MSESAAAAASPAPAQSSDFSAHADADLFEGMALAATCAARAHACFAEFHKRHVAYLYAVCARRYRDSAEEIVAETLRRVYDSAPRFDRAALSNAASVDAARQLVRAWVGQIVRWVAADHFAERERYAAVPLAPDGWLSEPHPELAETAGRVAELVAQVRVVIEDLPEREQEIAWTVAHGWSPEHGQVRWSQDDLDAIGERFGLSRDNIRQIRARLIRKLRARLEPLLNARPADR